MALALKTPLEQEFTLDKADAKYGDGTGDPDCRDEGWRTATGGDAERNL